MTDQFQRERKYHILRKLFCCSCSRILILLQVDQFQFMIGVKNLLVYGGYKPRLVGIDRAEVIDHHERILLLPGYESDSVVTECV